MIQTFSVSDDESLALVSSEKVGDKSSSNELRHKALSAEARLDQLLFRANIRSDYLKIHELRSKQLSLNLEWEKGEIKTLNAELGSEKKSLICQHKDTQDICVCSH